MPRREPWLAGRARIKVYVDVRLSPLRLPRGVPNAGLGISVRNQLVSRPPRRTVVDANSVGGATTLYEATVEGRLGTPKGPSVVGRY